MAFAPGTRGGAAVGRLAPRLCIGWLLLAATSVLAGCGDSPTQPSSEAVASIRVANETFRVRLTTQGQISGAKAAQAGGPARIPHGRIIPGTQVNVGYSWHLEDVSFVEVTIELCDGLPSMVEEAGGQWGNGFFCPWGAQIVAVQ